MIFKLSIVLLLLLLAGIWLFIGYYLKTSLLLGLGFGVIFGVILILLLDMLEWIMKENVSEEAFHFLNKEVETSLFFLPYFTYTKASLDVI
ncbi:hypothetical protein [Bacillus cereus]|uniref:hypothetical protein n=1 Tax=Bacillus cereus TaxID=1396 RepID=UPI0018F6BABF|nr:hypothetical protein [Bacillus cereus]MBJ8025929.1 hypothetical protein [Bacillus cereus]MBJ8038218.1 hypothetical protein [Bacillus cereus]